MVILIRASTYIVKNDICGGYFCMGDIGQIIKILPPALADKLRLHTLSFSRLNELRLRVGRNVTLIYDNKEIMYDIKVTKDCIMKMLELASNYSI